MKDVELKDALRLITKVLSEPMLEPDQRDQLQRAKRDLMAVAAAGKFDRHKVFRVVESVASVLLERVRH